MPKDYLAMQINSLNMSNIAIFAVPAVAFG